MKLFHRLSYLMQSMIPLNSFSPSAFLIACKRVLITSNGLTNNAANEPAAKPDRKEHLKIIIRKINNQKFLKNLIQIMYHTKILPHQNHHFFWVPRH